MTLLAQPAAQLSYSPEVLPRILEDDCNLAIWQRQPLSRIAALPLKTIAPMRFAASLSDLENRLEEECSAAGYPDSPALQALIRDIVSLADHYCAIMQLARVQVRLDIVTTDSCRKFHADYVKARLITTYAGTGTQWIEGADVARIAKGAEPANVNTLSAGDVGLFKGKMWTQDPAIHRSPPIAGTGEHRLVLVLDPVREG
ncbi:MAG: DUF1826 domain-containing protein [Pseudomonadota bacterium]